MRPTHHPKGAGLNHRGLCRVKHMSPDAAIHRTNRSPTTLQLAQKLATAWGATLRCSGS